VESPLVLAQINELISGDPGLDWANYVFRKYLLASGKGVERGLSLGCGDGRIERHMRMLAACHQIDAFDIAESAIAHARKRALESGIDGIIYQVRDLNDIKLPPNHYDVVVASSILHHISNLEGLLDQVRSSLKPGGLLVANEYVGPSQFQWTSKQVQIINEILSLLPEHYRRRVTDPHKVKDHISRPRIWWMNVRDPSEAIRSNEIVEMIERRFRIIERKDFGGTILHMLLQDIVWNFDPHDEHDGTILKLVLYVEKVLIEEEVIPSDFTLIVAEKANQQASFLEMDGLAAEVSVAASE